MQYRQGREGQCITMITIIITITSTAQTLLISCIRSITNT
jgi:hypothetical protein